MNKGFTLVELLVSLALFTIIVVAAVGSLYTVNQASVKVNDMRTVLDNLNFATESMSRTIRTGDNIICGGLGSHIGGTNSCPFGTTDGSGIIAFDSTIGSDQPLQYQFNPATGAIDKCSITSSTNSVTSSDATINQQSCLAITAPEITIQKMNFYVAGADSGDSIQPSVMMVIQGIANAGADNTAPFTIQTYVSQRAAE